MKIGSFFMVLLAGLVALGFFVSDSLHLREEVGVQQTEIERLTLVVQQAEQERQDALAALQTADQNLRSCQQQVDQSSQTIDQLTVENALLKEQVQVWSAQPDLDASRNAASEPQFQMVQASAIGLATFAVIGFGSFVAVGLREFRKHRKHKAKSGSYVFLTDAEIREVIRRRRDTAKPNASD